MSKDKNFYAFIHLLRAIAPIMVFWSHLVWWAMYNKAPWVFLGWVWQNITGPLKVYQNFGHLGVAIFFLISGFIISASIDRETRYDFAVKRVLRIFPALAVALVIVAIVQSLGLQSRVERPDPLLPWYEYIRAFFFIDIFTGKTSPLLPVRWSLAPEFLFYATACILMTWINKRAVPAMIGISLVFTAMTMIGAALPSIAYFGYYTLYIPLFMIGRSFYLYRNDRIGLTSLAGLTVLFLALIALAQAVRFPNTEIVVTTPKYLTYLSAVVIFSLAFAINQKKNSRIVSFYAEISYSMYLLHLPILTIMMPILTEFGIDYTISTLITFSVVTIASAACFKLIEMPGNRLARRILRKKTTPVSVTLDPNPLAPAT
ncbi:MAG: acyltransferase [Brucella anthropi]